MVLRVDEIDLPLFAQAKLWIDFSGQPDGPTGTGLLRLLHGLRGNPLSDEAVRVAAAYDDAVKRALAKIAAARANGDPDLLVELAKSDAPEWTTTSMLPCKVAEGLIALKKPDEALKILDAVTERFPRSVRPQQLKGLALARQGNWRAAQQVLGELHELGEKDPETLGILARTWRDRYAQSGDLLHLRKARNLYAEAFDSTPSDFYTGVNAAANSVLLGELDVADKYAAAVEKLVGIIPRPRRLLGRRHRRRGPAHPPPVRRRGEAVRGRRRRRSGGERQPREHAGSGAAAYGEAEPDPRRTRRNREGFRRRSGPGLGPSGGRYAALFMEAGQAR